ncbi:hypothetical protein J2Z30_004405 [Streptomyces iranensis]|uniref:Uncharacterized protein n=1 Tax=Streptomyces iranensis TaxID=576784 RepID=A0ABS4MUI9_9ACTN|nr:hypothetical protein [Streptomyces iranensis]
MPAAAIGHLRVTVSRFGVKPVDCAEVLCRRHGDLPTPQDGGAWSPCPPDKTARSYSSS